MLHSKKKSLTTVVHASLGLMMILGSIGCRGSQLGQHRWGGGPSGQGDMNTQKARAVYFDPYPLNDIGPEVVGGRPRGFMNPLAEPSRNELKLPQTLQNPWAGYGR